MPSSRTRTKVKRKESPIATSLVGLTDVMEIVNVSLMTSFIENAIPVSIMLIAPSGAGKTTIIRKFLADFIHKTNDLTTSGLWNILRNDQQEKITHIALEDFNPLLSHKSSVSNLTIASLLSVMADGVMRIDDGREQKELKHKPVGIVTGVTPDMFKDNLEKWQALGLVRRFLPVHYAYNDMTIQEAQRRVRNGTVHNKSVQSVTIPRPEKSANPKIPEEFARDIETQSMVLGNRLGVIAIVSKNAQNQWKKEYIQGMGVLPMAPHIVLRTMAQARALLYGRKICDKSDVDFIVKVVGFADPMQPIKL